MIARRPSGLPAFSCTRRFVDRGIEIVCSLRCCSRRWLSGSQADSDAGKRLHERDLFEKVIIATSSSRF